MDPWGTSALIETQPECTSLLWTLWPLGPLSNLKIKVIKKSGLKNKHPAERFSQKLIRKNSKKMIKYPDKDILKIIFSIKSDLVSLTGAFYNQSRAPLIFINGISITKELINAQMINSSLN